MRLSNFSNRFPFVEPPNMTSIDSALLRFQEQAALSTVDCSLTSIGSMLARLLVDVSIGKMLIFAYICLYFSSKKQKKKTH